MVVLFSCADRIHMPPDSINQYVDSERDGRWIEQTKEGYFLISFYDEGVLTRGYAEYYPDGQRRVIGNYSRGVKHGKWKVFSSKGTLLSETRYVRGIVKQNIVYNPSW